MNNVAHMGYDHKGQDERDMDGIQPYATAALRTSSISVRYEIASAKCTRETVAAPSRSASVRATRSTRVTFY
jgi:hypothetical protein